MIEVATQIEPPKFLVEWSSPWEEFLSSLQPALQRSPARLAGEARTELFPYQGMLLTWLLEGLALVALIVLPTKLASMREYAAPPMPKYDIIYFSGDELPRTEDRGGAQAGRTGRSGGREAHHRTQSIRVARGGSLREKVVDAPSLNLPVSKAAVANLLAYKPVTGPPPSEGLRSSLRSQRLPEIAAVAPPPEVKRDSMRDTPTLAPTVVRPSPTAPQRNLAALQLPGSQMVQVVPPPVSAPERASILNPRLSLPAPTVVAPPPTRITSDLSPRGPGLGAGELQKQVIPPPVQMNSAANQRRGPGGLEGNVSVVAPAQMQLNAGATQRTGTGLSGSVAVVPPPPSISGIGSPTGRGSGSRGSGFGGPSDSGDVAAPPKGGGNGSGTGIVVSSTPGLEKGIPTGGGAGALAMSPAGGSDPGLGGSGGGTGIGRGKDQGSGFSGEGPGAGKDGTGKGSDPNARGGISPYPGPGGAGNATNGAPAMPGVSVRGGANNIVTLPSFGPSGGQPTDPNRSSAGKDQHGPGITVVATSRSGGAFNFYGYLKGSKVYTIYLDTALGPAVMQYADPTSATRPYAEDLNAPEPIRDDLPAGIVRSRLVIACILDRSGMLKNFQVLEPGNAMMTSKVLAQLPKWKFRPVMRGNEPVEVNAILGFNIDTSDRN